MRGFAPGALRIRGKADREKLEARATATSDRGRCDESPIGRKRSRFGTTRGRSRTELKVYQRLAAMCCTPIVPAKRARNLESRCCVSAL
jgi:hypothetical protein